MVGLETESVAETDETEEGEEVPKIDMEELLDDFEDLDVADEE